MIRERNTGIMRRFIVFSIVLYLLIFVVGSVVFMLSMQSIIKTNKDNEARQMIELQRIKLENSINSEIAIVLKLADSPIIKRFFIDPDDPDVKQYALDEIKGYRRAFSSFSIFWVSDADKTFYADDNEPFLVKPDTLDHYWYHMTLYETEVYNFNINYNTELNAAKLWINAPVFDETGKPLGMVGTGIELKDYVEMIYQGIGDKVELFLFNEDGEITGSKDVDSVVEKKKIYDILDNLGIDVLNEAKSLQSGETRTFDTASGNVVIGTIPVLGWYTVAISPIGIDDYSPAMVALFLVMFAVIALIMFIFNMFISRFLKSLKKTMDSLRATSKAKSDFLATMSHEIRTPLNVILGIAQILLQERSMPKEYAEEIGKIYSSGTSLLGIINDILDMSKVETGKLELHHAQYETPSLINDAVQLNVVRIGTKPINFILEVDETLPSALFGDELRLKQILNNLLSNAIKYTQTGFVKLAVSHTVEDGETVLRFEVEDSGQGMKREDMARLFSEYSRFNTEANRTTEGTGLGLAITKQLVQMMGGEINVSSEYGKGSVFSVTVRQQSVPCEPIGAQVAQKLCGLAYSEKRQDEKTQLTRTPMPYGKVMVVDDMVANLHVAWGLLSLYELDIQTVGSGFAAIEKVQSGKVYDIIFMDHMMPQMDGIETTQKLREMGYNGPIVALTANALAGNDKMFAQKGFDGFISKPMDVRKLDAILNKFVHDCHPEEAKKHQDRVVPIDEAHTYSPAGDPQLIRVFTRDAQKTIVNLREAFAAEDLKMVTNAVHAIKPVLINLGAQGVADTAHAIESAGKRGEMPFIEENLEVFIKKLENLIQKYSLSETQNEDADEDEAYTAEQLKLVVDACLDYDDSLAFEALDRLAQKPLKPETRAAVQDIKDMLFLHSDFTAAAERAEGILDRT